MDTIGIYMKKRLIHSLKNTLRPVVNSLSYATYYNSALKDNAIFIESRQGRDIAGNILNILIDIKRFYKEKYSITIASRKDSINHIKQILEVYKITNNIT